MKKICFFALVALFALNVNAQEKPVYTFTDIVNLDKTETKDQCRTGTCWSYATGSFIESELMRMGKGEHDLSEMFNVRMTYPKKAEMYLRYQGKTQFGPGSLSHDVINAIAIYGVVPESVYSGLQNKEKEHDHAEMDAVLEAMLKALTEQRTVSEYWLEAVNGVLDAYLGEVPESFEYQGKKTNPIQLRDDLGLKAEDYVSFSSFTHHPFYEKFILEVPDNFSNGMYYNVPMNDLVMMTEVALKAGYTVAWDADVSEKGFSFRNGVAVLIGDDVPREELFTKVHEEPEVTQEDRQKAYNSHSTTDDHLMHIVGMAKDQNGRPYFIIKNSWGSENPYGGLQYVSYHYFLMKTVGILLHKDAVSKAVSKNLKP